MGFGQWEKEEASGPGLLAGMFERLLIWRYLAGEAGERARRLEIHSGSSRHTRDASQGCPEQSCPVKCGEGGVLVFVFVT